MTRLHQRTPEEDLLLCCVRKQPETVCAGDDAVTYDNLDWQHLIRESLRNGVLPPLLCHLQATTCSDRIPQRVQDELKHRSTANTGRNLLLLAELLQLLKAFDDAGVRALPFKGPLLAILAYGSLALRKCGDLDILVPKEHLSTCVRILASRGYRVSVAGEAQQAKHSRHHHLSAYHAANHIEVEIHWEFNPPHFCKSLDFEEVWNRASPVTVAGRELPSLHRDDLLLMLSAHGARHNWECLVWICDIGQLVSAYSERDLLSVIERGRALGCERMVHIGLLLASDLLGVQLPTNIVRRIKSDRVTRLLARQVERSLFRRASLLKVLSARLFGVLVHESFPNQMMAFVHSLERSVTPNEHDKALVSLPRPLRFMYYLLRPIRILCCGVISPHKSVSQDDPTSEPTFPPYTRRQSRKPVGCDVNDRSIA